MACPAVVLIEDDKDIREAIKEILGLEGYTVWDFPNGKAAMEGLESCQNPCLILLDLMMPVMNGWEFMKQRKNLGDTIVAIPVYIMSAVGNQAEVQKTHAQGYIKKPVDIDILLRIVQGHCGEQGKAA